MTIIDCIRKRQLILRSLLALMFMIQPGIIAPVETEYSRISQAILLPDISSSTPVSLSDLSLNIKDATLSF
jgi:hypothetical protein